MAKEDKDALIRAEAQIERAQRLLGWARRLQLTAVMLLAASLLIVLITALG